jgi:transcriptional regulator with XRE-family HTH domain
MCGERRLMSGGARQRRATGAGGEESSPLRQAREAIPATLEQVCADLDHGSAGGSASVTPSMLSGWELGRHVTSTKYRRLLAAYYGVPVKQLFAHQDRQLHDPTELLIGYHDLRAAMIEVVVFAREYLVVLGSRSRDARYLEAIEAAVEQHSTLVHYRVLFGPPHHAMLKDHLLRLIKLRDPGDRSTGVKTLHLGMIGDTVATPERFLVASENQAVVPIPSLTSAEAFDCGMLLGAAVSTRLLDHARQCYAASQKIETDQALRDLETVRRQQR